MNLRKRCLVKPGSAVDLSKIDPECDGGIGGKARGRELLAGQLKRLDELQYTLYAEGKRSLLVVLQAMDAGGKDGTIRHVFGPVNPQGCRVHSFKKPSDDELAHDFLWRIHRACPARGEIGVFNRSHYEDVLVVRVHDIVPKKVWSKRFEQINDFERMLAANGTAVIKFFLHISADEQLARLQARLDDPEKIWKANPADFEERKYWDSYQKAFQDVLRKTSTAWAPWYVIPANAKWFRDLAVASIVADTLADMKLKFPAPVCDPSTMAKA